MMRHPLVSIALPTFNGEKTVSDAIASILLQTYSNWELLVIDDGSFDGTADIARKFKDPRIKVFADGANKGLPARLNEAIDRSAGRYFARMDQDDISFPDRLSRQVEFLEMRTDVDLLATRALTFITPGKLIGLFPFRETHDEICRRPWAGFYMPHPTWMGRLDWFRQNRYYVPEVRRAEDQDLLLRAMLNSRYACLPEILFAYRVRPRASLRINLTARRSLLLRQLEIFRARTQWGNFILALLAFVGKSANDLGNWLLRRREWKAADDVSKYSEKWEDMKSAVLQLQRRMGILNL